MKTESYLNYMREQAARVTIDPDMDQPGLIHMKDSDDLNEVISFVPRLLNIVESIMQIAGNDNDIMEIIVDELDNR